MAGILCMGGPYADGRGAEVLSGEGFDVSEVAESEGRADLT